VTHGVHAWTDDVQPPSLSAVCDRVPSDPDRHELPARDHSVLAFSKLPKHPVEGRVRHRAAYSRPDVDLVRHEGDGGGGTRTRGHAGVTTVHVEPAFFESPGEFRAWLEENHLSEDQLWVGFHKKDSGRPSLTWADSVDQALCFGWIDGRLNSIDADSYMIRFTPRRKRSKWSKVNVERFGKLRVRGLVSRAGIEAFERRVDSGYSHERDKPAELGPEYEKRLQANSKAWAYFRAQAPWYRRSATHWVISAKKEETRERRLNRLVEDSANERPIGPLTRPGR
jgi:uncharacterized protein YdeI (YjbR/CyaY-like superfamily)